MSPSDAETAALIDSVLIEFVLHALPARSGRRSRLMQTL